jgi:hypothetical protein
MWLKYEKKEGEMERLFLSFTKEKEEEEVGLMLHYE